MTKARAAPKPNNLVYLNRDRGYRFTDRDPQMIELCSLIYQSGLSVGEIIRKVTEATGGAYTPGDTTVYNWLSGKTKRPQSYTMNWVAYAIGYERKWTKLT